MSQEDFLFQVAASLEAAQIPFMVAGSHGSSLHGQARATNDIDVIIDPTPQQLDEFLRILGNRYYVSADAAREALAQRSMFNIIDFSTGFKADFIVRKDRPFSAEEFQRRKSAGLGGREIPVASPEDIILSKLEWNKITPSERQVQDAFHVIASQGAHLDLAYLRKWAPDLGVSQKLEDLLARAGELEQGKPP